MENNQWIPSTGEVHLSYPPDISSSMGSQKNLVNDALIPNNPKLNPLKLKRNRKSWKSMIPPPPKKISEEIINEEQQIKCGMETL